MTGRDLVTASLRLIGAIAPGESLSASEATDGLAALNRMLGSWSNENLLIHMTDLETFVLTPSKQTYTMGPSGDFDTTRPTSIQTALLRITTNTPPAELPINILTEDQWAAIVIKEINSTIPVNLYAEGTYPLLTINLWPIPSAGHSLVLYSLKPLTEIATLDTSVSLPPGYDRALIYNLALDISPEYGKVASDIVAMTALDSKAAIKRTNYRPRYLKVDPALTANGGRFDIIRGGTV